MRMLSVTNFQNGGQAKEGNKKKQSDFAMNTQHTPSLERRIHGRKIQRKFVPLFNSGGTFLICACVKEISPETLRSVVF